MKNTGLLLSPPQRLLQWENGEKMEKKREITGKLKKSGGRGGRWEGPKGGSFCHFMFSKGSRFSERVWA